MLLPHVGFSRFRSRRGAVPYPRTANKSASKCQIAILTYSSDLTRLHSIQLGLATAFFFYVRVLVGESQDKKGKGDIPLFVLQSEGVTSTASGYGSRIPLSQ